MVHRLIAGCVMLIVVLCAVTPVAAQAAEARVRVVHASPDAGPLDVLIDGKVMLTALLFQNVSEYLPLPTGAHQITVVPTGQNASAAIFRLDLAAQPERAYTVATIGLKRTNTLTSDVYDDSLVLPPPGHAMIRLIHASPDAPGIDVAVKGCTTLFGNVNYLHSTEYLAVSAGAYDLVFKLAGTDTVMLDLNGAHLRAGMIYDVISMGQYRDRGFRATLAQHLPDSAVVRVASTTAPVTTVSLDTCARSVFAARPGMPARWVVLGNGEPPRYRAE